MSLFSYAGLLSGPHAKISPLLQRFFSPLLFLFLLSNFKFFSTSYPLSLPLLSSLDTIFTSSFLLSFSSLLSSPLLSSPLLRAAGSRRWPARRPRVAVDDNKEAAGSGYGQELLQWARGSSSTTGQEAWHWRIWHPLSLPRGSGCCSAPTHVDPAVAGRIWRRR